MATPKQVIGQDENGIMKLMEYKFNDEGKLAETRAIERRSWAVFGDAVNDDAGGRLTMISTDEIFFERPGEGLLKLCRICRTTGDHWTTQCLCKDLPQASDTSSSETHVAPPGGASTSAYVPASRRGVGASGRTGTGGGGGDTRCRNEENGVRINNLPEETTQQDLYDLCSPFGQVSRVFMAMDRETGLCREGYNEAE